LKCLIEPIVRNASSVTYGRQIPHAGANILESFSREFNYPAESHVRALEDVQKHGVYTIFCSNSFAAYSQRALDEIGGFPRVRFGEDTLVVSKLIQKGHKVAYVSEAIVRHSHAYSLKQDFVRNFEIGAMRKTHRELIDVYGRDNARGREYASQLVKKLIMEKPHLVPLGIAKLFSSWLGYKLGRFSVKVD
jgi:rhamnosyltransferase